jgi:hypothetical protein
MQKYDFKTSESHLLVNVPTLKGQNCKKKNIPLYLEMIHIIMRLVILKKFSNKKFGGTI